MIWIVGVWVNIAACGAMLATMPGPLAESGIVAAFHNPRFADIPYWWKFFVTFVSVYVICLLSPLILLAAIVATLRERD